MIDEQTEKSGIRSRFWQRSINTLSFFMAAFFLYTGLFGLLPSLRQRAVFVFGGMLLTFLLYPARKGTKRTAVPLWDVAAAVVVAVAAGYVFINHFTILSTYGQLSNPFNLTLGALLVVLLLFGTFRQTGIAFPVLTLVLILYALLGHLIPGMFGHGYMSWDYVIDTLYLSDLGIWGPVTGIGATFLAVFIILGSVLLISGVGQTFIDLASTVAGRYRGGPAKIAVVSSAFFGTISGSAVANTSATGNFTIPLMKKIGYPPAFAASVEAVASTGGQFTPPILGSAAFIMAELLGISYLSIAAASLIPAFIFFTAVFASVHFRAIERHLLPVPPEQRIPLRRILTWARIGPFLLPIAALLFLISRGYTLQFAASVACVMGIVLFIFADVSFDGIIARARRSIDSLVDGGKALAPLASMLVCANIVSILLTFTGLAAKFSNVFISVGESSLLLSLALAAVVVVILGMGVTTPVAYIIGVIIAGPSLIKLGLPPLAAHFFIFYWACLSSITPPVAPAVFVAATISRTSWLPVAWNACKLALVIYIIPFVIAYDPALLLIGSPLAIASFALSATVGAVALAGGIVGCFLSPLNWLERVLFFTCGIMLLLPATLRILDMPPQLFGLVLLFVITSLYLFKLKRLHQTKENPG